MKTNAEKNLQTRTFVMLALLFVSHWLFYKIELGIIIMDWIIVTEYVLFFVFYAMALVGLPPLLPGLWALLCCGVMSVIYWYSHTYSVNDRFLPLTYLPALLFFVFQYSLLRENKRLCFSGVWLIMMHVFIWTYLGVIIYVAVKKLNSYPSVFASDANYSTVILVLLGVLFALLRRAPSKKTGAGRALTSEEMQQMRASFAFAIITMLQDAAFFRIYRSTALSHTVPLLWCVNLLMLYELEHPLVRGLVSGAEQKLSAFLREDADAKTEV